MLLDPQLKAKGLTDLAGRLQLQVQRQLIRFTRKCLGVSDSENWKKKEPESRKCSGQVREPRILNIATYCMWKR